MNEVEGLYRTRTSQYWRVKLFRSPFQSHALANGMTRATRAKGSHNSVSVPMQEKNISNKNPRVLLWLDGGLMGEQHRIP